MYINYLLSDIFLELSVMWSNSKLFIALTLFVTLPHMDPDKKPLRSGLDLR
jgi:hypothetical protein